MNLFPLSFSLNYVLLSENFC